MACFLEKVYIFTFSACCFFIFSKIKIYTSIFIQEFVQ